MCLNRPLIGITPGYDYEEQRIYLNSCYIESINKAGGLAVILPLTDDEEVIANLVETCDGLLLSGGPDIDAIHFNENNMPYNGTISPLRDNMELAITKKIFEQKKPVFGICRGAQVLNVAMGGTIYQDIASQVKDERLLKHSQQAPRWYPTHDIYIAKNSNVGASFNYDSIRVNSFHHQAIKDVAPSFKTTSKANDGIVESIEFDGDIFAIGVQWHPEHLWQKNHVHLKIFEKFIAAAMHRGHSSMHGDTLQHKMNTSYLREECSPYLFRKEKQ